MIGKNNPFNVRYSSLNHWTGQIGNNRGFCEFDTLYHGVRAAAKLIFVTYPRYGARNVERIINRFAPPTENDTSSYIHYVCGEMAVLPFAVPSNREERCELLMAMAQFESNSGNEVMRCVINDVLKDLKL